MTKDDGGPAFPTGEPHWLTGMTLRDWFAGQAFAGLLSSPIDIAVNGNMIVMCKLSYAAADAMIAERKK